MLVPRLVSACAAGEFLAFKLASKAQLAATFLSKDIQFPVNPLASCPKSRCNLLSGTSNDTVTSMLTGLPLFDLFTKMGVTMGLGANQLLTFDVTKLNKVRRDAPCASWQRHAQVLQTLPSIRLHCAGPGAPHACALHCR